MRIALVTAAAAVLCLLFVPVLMSPPSQDPAAEKTATCRDDAGDAGLIQAAIDAAPTGGGVVIVGPCRVDRTIVLHGERAYRGAGIGTTLKAAPGAHLAAVLASDSWAEDRTSTGLPVSVRDLTVDANRAQGGSAGDAIVIRSWRTTLTDVTVRSAAMNGIRITSISRNGVRLTGTQVNGTLRDVLITDSGQNGVYVEDPGNAVTDWTLTDSWIASSGSDGIKADNSAGWTFRNNHVYGNETAGLRLDRLFATSVVENYVEDFTAEALRVTVQGGAGSLISGNRLFQFTGAGGTFLHVAGVNYGTGQLVVTGNVIRGAGTGTGMLFERGDNQLVVVSTGNSVSDVSVPRQMAPGVVLSQGI